MSGRRAPLKHLLFILLMIPISQAFAIEIPPDYAQSSPALKWHSIENDVVRVIYPESVKGESVYLANLVEHYSHVVGQTYGITKPKLFNLVVRSEMGLPNGYVALAPRRSEWFTSSIFFPFVGTTEWFQTLSIHEYRHVNQYDHFNQGGVRKLYYLMGDFGVEFASAVNLPSWYYEGDAVWAETKYTDAGRGRSPRFISRLKALVLSDKIPTYDEFLSGSYKTEIPNQYLYGYTLISYGTQKFGEDIWKKIIHDTAAFPYPLRFYSSFKSVTGQPFNDFYKEAMQDLRTKWSKDSFADGKWTEYHEANSPVKADEYVYYVRQTLNTHAQLIREKSGHSEVVLELPFNKEFQILDINATHLIHNENLPDARFTHKGSSDLVLIDLKTRKKNKLTTDQRLYNPRFNATGNKIIAVSFKADQSWNIAELDLTGKLLNEFSIPEGKVAEAVYIDDQTAAVLLNTKTGNKTIVTVDLKSQKITKTLVPASRNVLHSLYADRKKNILFEAQYKGYTEIFKLNDQTGLSQCTTSKLGSYSPSSDGENIFFSEETLNGTVIRATALTACQNRAIKDIVDFNYLGDTASDNYNKFPPQAFADQEQLFTKNADKYQPKEYGDFDSKLFIPHTWGLIIDRGTGLGFNTDNYLRTLGFSALVGTDAEENAPLVEFNFDIKKYYPLFRLQVESRERNVTDFVTKNETQWEEQNAGAAVQIPYLKRSGFYNFAAILSLEGVYTDASDFKVNKVSLGNSGEYLYKTGTGAGVSWSKDMTARSIQSPWLVSYHIQHEDASNPNNSALASYRTLQKAQINTPGFSYSDGFMISFDEQNHKDTVGSYRFLPESSLFGYTLSRGYEYEYVPRFQKVTGNYVFPIAYPDFDLDRFYYLKRVYGNVFYDSTKVETSAKNETLDSFGLEVLFESKIIRFMPVTFGGRVLQRLQDDEVKSEFFMASKLAF